MSLLFLKKVRILTNRSYLSLRALISDVFFSFSQQTDSGRTEECKLSESSRKRLAKNILSIQHQHSCQKHANNGKESKWISAQKKNILKWKQGWLGWTQSEGPIGFFQKNPFEKTHNFGFFQFSQIFICNVDKNEINAYAIYFLVLQTRNFI